jgi:hypothetical protein
MAMDMHMAIDDIIISFIEFQETALRERVKDFVIHRVASITDESAQATSTG